MVRISIILETRMFRFSLFVIIIAFVSTEVCAKQGSVIDNRQPQHTKGRKGKGSSYEIMSPPPLADCTRYCTPTSNFGKSISKTLDEQLNNNIKLRSRLMHNNLALNNNLTFPAANNIKGLASNLAQICNKEYLYIKGPQKQGEVVSYEPPKGSIKYCTEYCSKIYHTANEKFNNYIGSLKEKCDQFYTKEVVEILEKDNNSQEPKTYEKLVKTVKIGDDLYDVYEVQRFFSNKYIQKEGRISRAR